MKNRKLAKQFNDLLACPTVNGILQNFVRGEGNLTIKTEEIKDPENPPMVTRLKDGKVSITVNSKFVDGEKGFNLSSDGNGSAGYKYNGTRQGTFAAVFAHESYHAQYDIQYSLAAKACNSSVDEDVYNQLVRQGQTGLANAFFQKNSEGEWVMRTDVNGGHHELIKLEKDNIDKVVKEFGSSTNW